MKKVLVLVFSNLKHDARVMRQINWLRRNHIVTVVCFDADEIEDVKFVRVKQTKLSLPRKSLLALTLLIGAYKQAYGLLYDYASSTKSLKDQFDLIVANDIETLPLAFQLKGETEILFDAHEYAPRHFENNRVWKTFFQPFYIHLCARYIPGTAAMLTVGQGLANEYEKFFHIKPVIITNATRFVNMEASEVLHDKIRLVHHGIINPSRRLELMVEMMNHLDDRFTLDMILMTSDYASAQTKAYIKAFREKAENHPRIKILPPVKSDLVVSAINGYDIGLFLIPPVNFNYANTLPNKLFDFIQARLGIAIGPSPEMAAIVKKFNNGVIADDFMPQDLARKLNALTREDIIRFKVQSARAAQEVNAEKNEAVFNQVLEDIFHQETK